MSGARSPSFRNYQICRKCRPPGSQAGRRFGLVWNVSRVCPAKYVDNHGTPDDVKEVESGQKSVSRKAKEIRERQENKKSGNQTRDEEPGPEENEHRAETEVALTRKEWKTCIQTLKQTLLLDCSNVSPAETRDRVARFHRALQEKTISKKARKEMKTAVAVLLERCQEVLRQLE